ncbi:efflux RND transporter periplasmic adaptor subunit [Sulfurimonas sp. SAG-AH-194-I05]|nr:efflux RND transporter periplasmic adaptor subunit [Sulfurimonas sp. SAG-AH-194-I05]MDF1875969.1 efflux RND transporter periplasmic adaptor subunit [Sulfurimonas sp. SAG-AH-194-I05]
MNKSIIITAGVMLSAGIGIGYLVLPLITQAPQTTEVVKKGLGKEDKKILFYRNSMNPSVTSPVPKKDNMGMDYVPVYADNMANMDKKGTVSIDPVMVQNIGVRTSIVKRESLSKTIRALGRVDFDEESISRLHPKVEGWIADVFVNKTGEKVKKGDILVNIYSPKLVSTEEEYLLAINSLKVLKNSPFNDIRNGAENLVKSSRKRLQLLDVPEHQIRELKKSKKIKRDLHIHTTVGGTITKIGIRKGQYVTPQTELYTIVDLSRVWVYAEVYDYELSWIKVGDEVEMTLASVPGKVFKGTLNYIYPYSESKTRTTKVRVIFDNKKSLLRPDMFSELKIKADTQKDVIVVPAEAIIRSGTNTQVFVLKGPGKFEPRIVKIGTESQGKVVILLGLDEGEEVVTSAQFLVDSESKLREATQKMMSVVQPQNKEKVK